MQTLSQVDVGLYNKAVVNSAYGIAYSGWKGITPVGLYGVSCGNGHIDPGEECDLGSALNGAPNSACSSSCTWQNCTINSVSVMPTPSCNVAGMPNYCGSGSNVSIGISYSGSSCLGKNVSLVQTDLTTNLGYAGPCVIQYTGANIYGISYATTGLTSAYGLSFNYTVPDFTAYGANGCIGADMTTYYTSMQGGSGSIRDNNNNPSNPGVVIGPANPGVSAYGIVLSSCNNSYYQYQKFAESPPYWVYNNTKYLSRWCNSGTTATVPQKTYSYGAYGITLNQTYMCGQKDGICPNDFTATPICGIGSSPQDPDCGAQTYEQCGNYTGASGINLGVSCNTPTPTPHAACPPSAYGSCVYADEDTGDHVTCYTNGASILRATSSGAYGTSSPEWFNTTIDGTPLSYNATITCNGPSNTWCPQEYDYSPSAIIHLYPGCNPPTQSGCAGASYCPQVLNYTMNSFGKPPIISAYGSVYGYSLSQTIIVTLIVSYPSIQLLIIELMNIVRCLLSFHKTSIIMYQ